MTPTTLATRFDLVILDWAGTMVDFGCLAPVKALIEAFSRHGVALTEQQARQDMGKAKADHVQALLRDSSVAAAWVNANGKPFTDRDRDELINELGPLMQEQAAQAATLIDGARDAVETLRNAGLQIASSTGYTREMMQPVLERAFSQGYAPDHLVCSGETPKGRPSPLMIYKACVDLAVWPLSRVVKVDDSESGIEEGRAAGCLTVGVSMSGNGVGLSPEAFQALSPQERKARVEKASQRLYAAGADLVIDSVATLVPALERFVAEHAV